MSEVMSIISASAPFTLTRMKPKITVITLGVDDLERSLRFYRDGLGFATEIGRAHV